MGFNYLKRYYLEDHKLAQRARLEFYRALSTGRMIAFTGSMATQAFGYGGWQQLRMTISGLAADAIHDLKEKEKSRAASVKLDRILSQVESFEARSAAGQWSVPVGMSLVEEALERWDGALPRDWSPWLTTRAGGTPLTDGVDRSASDGSEGSWPLDRYKTLREGMRVGLARRFRQPLREWSIDRGILDQYYFNREFNVPRALWRDLGIRRFATPSYDFEIERATMLSDGNSSDRAASPFDALRALRMDPRENFYWDLGSGRIRRVFPDGWAVESDVLNRERIDRMIEFAVGTDAVDGHILHLHGRACNWRTMIATQSDYDRLYRRNDLNRGPFEFAKRLMMGGNPILFIGLGMSEAELNHEMQEFISNNPYNRVAQTFLIWSAKAGSLMNASEVSAKRIDFLRRLGVLTLFDTDFGGSYASDRRISPKEQYNEADARFMTRISTTTLDAPKQFNEADRFNFRELYELKSSVDTLTAGLGPKALPLHNPSLREQHIGDSWRSMSGRVAAKGNVEPVVLWSVKDTIERQTDRRWISKLMELTLRHPLMCIIGPQGCGKGSLVRAFANSDPAYLGLLASDHCLLVNGGFSFDTDTLLDGVARFLVKILVGPNFGERPETSRSRLFADLRLGAEADSESQRALIIINGMDRFFDLAGLPLSAELDELLNLAVGRSNQCPVSPHARTRWILLGTERVRKYMTEIGVKVVDFSEITGLSTNLIEKNPDGSLKSIPSQYLKAVWQGARPHLIHPHEFEAAVDSYYANGAGRISGDVREMRRALFGALFDEQALAGLLKCRTSSAKVVTARAILKGLAFVGVAVEKEILGLLPGLADFPDFADSFEHTLEALINAHLVLRLDGYRRPDAPLDEGPPRFALHRMLLTELRFRFGIPLSEAKLSTAFNMSLYVAQPIDGDIPDTDIHEQLGNAIDKLIGSYKTVEGETRNFAAFERALGFAQGDYKAILEDVARACGSSHFPRDDEDLLELDRLCGDRHGQALRAALALVRGYYSTTGLLTLDSGDRMIRQGHDGVLLEHAERLGDLIDGYGKRSLARAALREALKCRARPIDILQIAGNIEPLYADELVWLHNERGVVRLAMGDLYEARRSFDQAMKVNREWVEREDRAHNWRRIRLNQLTVDIEMGEISVAERKCDELILVSSCDVNRNKAVQLREDRLATAISIGYKGWCLHLRGQAKSAADLYEQTFLHLSALGEVRAQAYFERLRANAMASISSPEERRKALERARDLAQSAVQMDIVHRLQIALADTYLFDPEPTSPEMRKRAHRYLEEALTYAIHTDVHRVRCEASMATARARLHMSDFEGALRYATDAMMVATRYGLELRKISLRALIAKIMAARGHPVTAEHLARTCIKMATRKRYQTAIDEAAEVIIGIPRISSAISNSDKSGVREF